MKKSDESFSLIFYKNQEHPKEILHLLQTTLNNHGFDDYVIIYEKTSFEEDELNGCWYKETTAYAEIYPETSLIDL